MGERGFADFLHRSDTVAGLLCDRIAFELDDFSRALHDLHSLSGIDPARRYTTSREGENVSLNDLTSRNIRLARELANAVAHDASTTMTDPDIIGLLNELHHHAMDLAEVLGTVAASNNHPTLRSASAAAAAFSRSAEALVGFAEAYQAGQQLAATPTVERPRSTGGKARTR